MTDKAAVAVYVFWNVDFILNILSGYITDADGYSDELLA
jgi:hypothetical protein